MDHEQTEQDKILYHHMLLRELKKTIDDEIYHDVSNIEETVDNILRYVETIDEKISQLESKIDDIQTEIE